MRYAKRFVMVLKDQLIISLTDHISFALERALIMQQLNSEKLIVGRHRGQLREGYWPELK